MDGSYCNDMATMASLLDFQRGLEISLHAPQPTGTREENRVILARLKWHALTLWHEAGKPLPFVAHLGPFVQIASASPAQEKSNGA